MGKQIRTQELKITFISKYKFNKGTYLPSLKGSAAIILDPKVIGSISTTGNGRQIILKVTRKDPPLENIVSQTFE